MDRAESLLRIEVVASAAPRQVTTTCLTLPARSTVRDALEAAGVLGAGAALPDGSACGVWSRRCEPGRVLRDGDRVELYRALTVDPKEARRLRYKGQPKRRRVPAAGTQK